MITEGEAGKEGGKEIEKDTEIEIERGIVDGGRTEVAIPPLTITKNMKVTTEGGEEGGMEGAVVELPIRALREADASTSFQGLKCVFVMEERHRAYQHFISHFSFFI